MRQPSATVVIVSIFVARSATLVRRRRKGAFFGARPLGTRWPVRWRMPRFMARIPVGTTAFRPCPARPAPEAGAVPQSDLANPSPQRRRIHGAHALSFLRGEGLGMFRHAAQQLIPAQGPLELIPLCFRSPLNLPMGLGP